MFYIYICLIYVFAIYINNIYMLKPSTPGICNVFITHIIFHDWNSSSLRMLNLSKMLSDNEMCVRTTQTQCNQYVCS